MSRSPFVLRPPMTPRETEIAIVYARTWSMKETATEMGIGYGTVRERLNRARARYGVESIGLLFVALGWLRPRLTGSSAQAGMAGPSR